ncbi:MAG: hypothetical protein R3Y64_10270 [Peptostreptococcaceae bacterium]
MNIITETNDNIELGDVVEVEIDFTSSFLSLNLNLDNKYCLINFQTAMIEYIFNTIDEVKNFISKNHSKVYKKNAITMTLRR